MGGGQAGAGRDRGGTRSSAGDRWVTTGASLCAVDGTDSEARGGMVVAGGITAWLASTVPAVTIAATASPATALVAKAHTPAVRSRRRRRPRCTAPAPAAAPAPPAPARHVALRLRRLTPSLVRTQLLEQQKRPDRQDRGQRHVVVLEVLAKCTAALAVAHVAAYGARVELDQALGDFAELQARPPRSSACVPRRPRPRRCGRVPAAT